MLVAMQTAGEALGAYVTMLALTVGGLIALGRLGVVVPGLYPETGRHRTGESVHVILARPLTPGGEERAPVRPGRGSKKYRRLPTSRLAAAEASVARKAEHLRTVSFADVP